MEIDCHNRSVDRYIKVKKGNVLLYGPVKVSAISFGSRDDRFYRYVGVNFTFGLLDCDRYIRYIVIPWIVKSGFCSIHCTVTLAGLQNVNRCIGNIVLSKIVISGFHCSTPRKEMALNIDTTTPHNNAGEKHVTQNTQRAFAFNTSTTLSPLCSM